MEDEDEESNDEDDPRAEADIGAGGVGGPVSPVGPFHVKAPMLSLVAQEQGMNKLMLRQTKSGSRQEESQVCITARRV